MKMRTLFIQGVAASALFFAAASPAAAQSRTDRARMAITEAQAKVDAAIKVGATTEAPTLVTEAQASIRSSQENLERGNKDAAIADAHRASAFADQALGVTEQHKSQNAQAERERRQNAETTAVAAQADANAERDSRTNAENAAGAAQAEAAQANDRAAQAQAAANSSAADAAAARAAAATPATTVTVERSVTQPAYSARPTVAPRKPAARRPAARKPARAAPAPRKPAVTTTTTTTIKTEPRP